jgi:hypothetical protein
MELVLKNANNSRNKKVEVNIHDRVRITEWDGIVVEGIVKSIEKDENGRDIITVHHAKFIEGCYDDFDYSALEQQTTFSFYVDRIFEIKVATFDEEFSPLALVQKALSENYCGSEAIVMSPLFFAMYQRYMKEPCTHYCQYEIRVDHSLEGLVVYAIPNEESRKHKLTPKQCYSISFYKSGKWMGFKVFSAFEDEVEKEIEEAVASFKRNTGIDKVAFKLVANDQVVKRGVA